MIDRQYILESEGEKFVLRIEPPIAGMFGSRAFDSYKAARGHASGMKLSYGGLIVDRSTQAQFHTRPEFRFFSDLTPQEIAEAEGEMRRRADEDSSEAERLKAALAARSRSDRKAVAVQQDDDGQFAVRLVAPSNDSERKLELRFPIHDQAKAYADELTLTWAEIFGPVID